MLRKLSILLVAFALLSLASANEPTPIAYGYVSIEIVNRIPEIKSIELAPKDFYEDSEIQCIVTVDDEAPELVKLDYEWLVNERVVQRGSERFLGELEEGDELRCAVIPTDMIQQQGGEKVVVAAVAKAATSTKLIKKSLTLLGANINTEKTLELQKEGMMAVTGFAVKESMSKGAGIPLMLMLLLFLVIINLNILLRNKIRKMAKV